ncbi:MAG: putative deoxynucleotide monophosphate kinase [Verrucomicrobiaceae bacterium]|nr:putative deoxynucleotide monophosphate kinase [Verrucomicrobiaceae bacterium]
MILLGLTGPAGSGKSTMAKYLVEQHQFIEVSFADPIRDMIAALMRIDRSILDSMLINRAAKESPLPELGVSPRRLMQTLGTEWGRKLIDADLWVNLVSERIDFIEQALHREYNGIVISDVRMENEAKFVRSKGQLLHIERPDLTPIGNHESEAGIAINHRDHVVLNASIELLHRQANTWVNELQRRHAA